MQTQRILTGELQLGQTLNHCVHNGNKSEFDLLLAMLSTDVGEQDQFLIENTDDSVGDVLSLHEKFNIQSPQSLKSKSIAEDEYSLEFGKYANAEGIIAARLQHCLRPDALHFEPDTRHGLSSDVYDNLSPSIAQRLTDSEHQLTPLTVTMDELILLQKDYEAKLIAA